MKDELSTLRDQIGQAYSRKTRLTKRVSFWVKLLLVVGGTFVSSAAAFFSSDKIFPLTTVQAFGLAGLLLVLAGGIFVVITEEDSSETLDGARRAIDKALAHSLTAREIYEELLAYEDAVGRLSALYYSMSLARGTLEQAALQEQQEEEKLVQACLDSIKRELKVALGLQMEEVWTICIYKAERVSTGDFWELRLVAHDRSVPCDISKARKWRDGVGVGGIAFAKNDEVVVPNLDDPAVGSAFKLDANSMQIDDRNRYKSMFAVPISVGSEDKPWGVALATSNIPDYFGADDNVGVDPEEAVRALAGIIALAVALSSSKRM